MRTEMGTLARLAAIAGLFDAYRVFYRQPSDAEATRKFIGERLTRGDSHIFCVIDESDAVLGFTLLYPCFSSVSMAPIWILNDLFVDPRARRRGVGRMLLAAAREHAAATGAVRLELSTQKTNVTAQSLYESEGWVREELFYRYQLNLAD